MRNERKFWVVDEYFRTSLLVFDCIISFFFFKKKILIIIKIVHDKERLQCYWFH